jgi:outer membrane usher protein
VGAERTDVETLASFDINRPLPVGDGLAFRLDGTDPLSTSSGTNGYARAAVEAQNRFGHVQIGVGQEFNGPSTLGAMVEGSIVQVGRVFSLGRPVTESFALIEVPDTSGVRVQVNHQDMARTNRRGTLLVPGLQPYYGNVIAIDDRDVPLEFRLDRTEALVAPPYRGAARIVFATERLRTFIGSVVIDQAGVAAIPKYGEIDLTGPGGRFNSPLGGDGAFYFENATPGRYTATITTEHGGTCRFALELTASNQLSTNLGVRRCALPVAPVAQDGSR